jgi:hypothetical protein
MLMTTFKHIDKHKSCLKEGERDDCSESVELFVNSLGLDIVFINGPQHIFFLMSMRRKIQIRNIIN